jgi:hypothetical protein
MQQHNIHFSSQMRCLEDKQHANNNEKGGESDLQTSTELVRNLGKHLTNVTTVPVVTSWGIKEEDIVRLVRKGETLDNIAISVKDKGLSASGRGVCAVGGRRACGVVVELKSVFTSTSGDTTS